MTTPSDSADYREHPVYRELSRIFGNLDERGETRFFLLLPLVSQDDTLAFLRTVPAGTPWEKLLDLAIAYRDQHPVVITDSDDPESV